MFLAVSSKKDRRRLPRMRLGCVMEYRIEGTEEVVEGYAKTVSGGGLSFESDRALEPGTLVEIKVDPPLRLTNALTGVIEVTRCEPIDTGRGMPYAVAGDFKKIGSAAG
ncbi:MAG: PilZ domain-containing protein [Deltaproteobacteria bacterium]|nr:PilZ domain-containing protein [Deltaproteobacteria bacterium]